MSGHGRWVAVGVPGEVTHGGSLRARYLFQALIERTDALSMYRPDLKAVPSMLRRPLSVLPGANVAAAEFLPTMTVPLLRRTMRLRVVDVHDHPILHPAALGARLSPAQEADQRRLMEANLGAFEQIVVVSDTMADLLDLPSERRLVIGNGTDPRLITPGPWPNVPTVGLVSAAAPGRGIELLIDAMRLVREAVPDARLRLCLAAYERAGGSYLASLARHLPEWAAITSVPYRSLSQFLAGCTVLVVPHPPGPSWDAAPTIKLFDYLAAGRPVVVTPRAEPARVIRALNAGLVAAGDSRGELAAGIVEILSSEVSSRAMAHRARQAAEQQFDWHHLSSQLADAVLRP